MLGIKEDGTAAAAQVKTEIPTAAKASAAVPQNTYAEFRKARPAIARCSREDKCALMELLKKELAV